jgi:dipeptidase
VQNIEQNIQRMVKVILWLSDFIIFAGSINKIEGMRRTTLSAGILILVLLLANYQVSNGCTNFLITRGASVDGSTMITYAADAHVYLVNCTISLHRIIPKAPCVIYMNGIQVSILGQIPQPSRTYSVIGNMNEYQVAIGETTYGGREELGSQKGAIMDYGSLIYVTLQRAKTAREAIRIMADLVEKYGYYSSGESFSLADPNEVWIMELIGKGEGEKGAVWVALKVPDGYISGHANQARITTFPKNDPENCMYAPDVISFARKKGWYKGTDADFSFSDVYAPVDFGAARFCEARVWSGFNKVASGMDKYVDYAKGLITYDTSNNYATNRMPLWIKPDKKLSVRDVQNMMRDHYQGTELDMTKDVGAGPLPCHTALAVLHGRLTRCSIATKDQFPRGKPAFHLSARAATGFLTL